MSDIEKKMFWAAMLKDAAIKLTVNAVKQKVRSEGKTFTETYKLTEFLEEQIDNLGLEKIVESKIRSKRDIDKQAQKIVKEIEPKIIKWIEEEYSS